MSKKKLLENKSKSLLIISILVVLSLFAIYFIAPKIVKNKVDSQPGSPSNQVSIFQKLKYQISSRFSDQPVDQGSVFQDLSDQPAGDSPSDEMLKILSGSAETYWQNWSWQDKMVLSVVQEVDQVNHEMTVIISIPKDKEFSEKRRIIYVNCPVEQSALIDGEDPMTITQESGVDILGSVAYMDRLYAFCLDEDCLNLGRQCILAKVNVPSQ